MVAHHSTAPQVTGSHNMPLSTKTNPMLQAQGCSASAGCLNFLRVHIFRVAQEETDSVGHFDEAHLRCSCMETEPAMVHSQDTGSHLIVRELDDGPVGGLHSVDLLQCVHQAVSSVYVNYVKGAPGVSRAFALGSIKGA